MILKLRERILSKKYENYIFCFLSHIFLIKMKSWQFWWNVMYFIMVQSIPLPQSNNWILFDFWQINNLIFNSILFSYWSAEEYTSTINQDVKRILGEVTELQFPLLSLCESWVGYRNLHLDIHKNLHIHERCITIEI